MAEIKVINRYMYRIIIIINLHYKIKLFHKQEIEIKQILQKHRLKVSKKCQANLLLIKKNNNNNNNFVLNNYNINYNNWLKKV